MAAVHGAQPASTSSRFDSLPLVSKVAGMLRGLRFNVATQKLATAVGDEAGNDVNDNEKPQDDDDDRPLPAELGYEVPSTEAEDKSSRKKRDLKMIKKKIGRKERNARGEEKHQKMEEEDSTDTEEDLTGKTARKMATQMSEKGSNIDE